MERRALGARLSSGSRCVRFSSTYRVLCSLQLQAFFLHNRVLSTCVLRYLATVLFRRSGVTITIAEMPYTAATGVFRFQAERRRVSVFHCQRDIR